WPASSAACFTQFRIAWAEGSNCRPSSSGVRPFRTNSTSRARNSGGYGRWLFGIVDAPFRPNSGVSTKPGQLHFFVWWWRFGDARGTEEIWRQGAWLVSVPSHAAVFVAIVVAVRRARRLTGPTDTHGSARWATRA